MRVRAASLNGGRGQLNWGSRGLRPPTGPARVDWPIPLEGDPCPWFGRILAKSEQGL